MKAAVLRQLKKPLTIETNIKIPLLKRGQLLVEIAYSGVCQSQIQEADGGRGEDKYLPHFLGHEGAGKVVEVGPGVKKVKANDLVILSWIKGIGLDGGGVQYETEKGETINAGALTTFNTFAVVSENRVTLKPHSVPMNLAWLFGCALLTGAGTIINQIKPKEKDSVLIVGLGGVGISALLAALASGCQNVIAADIVEDKITLARKLGANHVIDLNQTSLTQWMANSAYGGGVDYAIEATGLASVIEETFTVVKDRGGRLVFISHPSSGQKIRLDPFDLIKGKKIEGSWGGESQPDRDIPILADLYTKNKFPIEVLTSKIYPLEDINIALNDLKKSKVNRPCLVLNETIV